MTREVPHAMPVSMRDEVNIKLGNRGMSALDNNARFIVRALVAEAYARGFQDGRWDQQRSADVDREVERSRADHLDESTK